MLMFQLAQVVITCVFPQMLKWFEWIYSLNTVSFKYFMSVLFIPGEHPPESRSVWRGEDGGVYISHKCCSWLLFHFKMSSTAAAPPLMHRCSPGKTLHSLRHCLSFTSRLFGGGRASSSPGRRLWEGDAVSVRQTRDAAPASYRCTGICKRCAGYSFKEIVTYKKKPFA